MHVQECWLMLFFPVSTHSCQESLVFINVKNPNTKGMPHCCKSSVQFLFIARLWSHAVWVLLSVPDDGSLSEDRSAPPSPDDRDSGLFLLKKDSERRAILYKVLNDDQEKVISNLRENHMQVCVCALMHHPCSMARCFQLFSSPGFTSLLMCQKGGGAYPQQSLCWRWGYILDRSWDHHRVNRDAMDNRLT